MNLLRILTISFISLAFYSCFQENETKNFGEITFSFSSITSDSIEGGRISEQQLTSIIVSIEGPSGEMVFENQELSIIKFGNGYISDPLSLHPGSYHVTKFLVLDSEHNAVFSTPIEGSSLASLIENPLPIQFSINANHITEVELEVISTSNHDPSDFGYSTFRFTIVPTSIILVSVLRQDDMGSYSFVDASLEVFGDDRFLYAIQLGDSVNLVTLRTDFDLVELKFENEGATKNIKLDKDSIQYYSENPLTIIFRNEDISDDVPELIAYYPFNGNANDESGNELNGMVSGAILTVDRHGNENMAYLFISNEDVIIVPDNDLLDISDDLTISVWINLFSNNNEGSRIVDKIISGTGIGYMVDIFNKENRNLSPQDQLQTIRFVGTHGTLNTSIDQIELNVWNHITVTYKSGNVKIYLNGFLISNTQEVATSLLTNNEPLQIGNDQTGDGPNPIDHFNGMIDEVKIYHDVLSPEQILQEYQSTK